MHQELMMNLKDLEKIIKLVEGANINQLKLEEDGTTIEIIKAERSVSAPIQHQVVLPSAPVVPTPVMTVPVNVNASDVSDNEVALMSPMVGAFYAASSPDSPDFVKVDRKSTRLNSSH